MDSATCASAVISAKLPATITWAGAVDVRGAKHYYNTYPSGDSASVITFPDAHRIATMQK
jgi:hypothetical protein